MFIVDSASDMQLDCQTIIKIISWSGEETKTIIQMKLDSTI